MFFVSVEKLFLGSGAPGYAVDMAPLIVSSMSKLYHSFFTAQPLTIPKTPCGSITPVIRITRKHKPASPDKTGSTNPMTHTKDPEKPETSLTAEDKIRTAREKAVNKANASPPETRSANSGAAAAAPEIRNSAQGNSGDHRNNKRAHTRGIKANSSLIEPR